MEPTQPGAVTGPKREERILAEQVLALHQTAPSGLLAALVAAFVLAGALVVVYDAPPWRVGIWLALAAADVALRVSLCLAWLRGARTDWRAAARRFTLASLAGGLVWGFGAIGLATPGDVEQQLLIVLVVSATVAGTIPAYGSYLPAALAYIVPAVVPYIAWVPFNGGRLSVFLTLLALLFLVAISVLAWRANRNLIESIRLRFDNLDLSERERREREAAEQASLAKSRFLAAASHDLRQPAHALGMFVAALRERPLDAESQRLAEHIDGAVQSLDSLFGSLLDISRLDAQVVHCRPEAFALAPLLARVCADHAADAQAKGIGLKLRPCPLAVRTDPVLFERVVRNLVGNAVRYTQRGRVVVAARRRARSLSVEVWDSGPGIPADQHQRIFEEFYQLENPERDRAKGLGLGLAIVRRLCDLLGNPLSLASRPGRGSVFKVSVPIADGVAFEARPDVTAPAVAQRGLVLVVDDEAAIRQAMHSLLTSWGHEVMTAPSCEEMLARLVGCAERPVLIICDYRLRGGENGIEVVERLRTEYNDDIPAMLITGDTAPDRLEEAHGSGLLLLHKPVPNGKLRAAMGNLMRRAASGDA